MESTEVIMASEDRLPPPPTDQSPKMRFCIPGDITTPEIITIIIVSIGLILSIIISIITIKCILKMAKLNKILKYLYITSNIAICLDLIFGILSPTLCHLHSESVSHIMFIMGLLFYYILMLNLLATLIYRLYITFNQSIYKITKIKKYIVNSLFIITCLLFLTTMIIQCISAALIIQKKLENGERRQYMLLAIYFNVTAFLTYIITSAFVVYLFARNMMKLTHSRATSMRNVHDMNMADINLNKKQTKFIKNITRYVSLFSVALISSIFSMIWVFIVFGDVLPAGIQVTAFQLVIQESCIDAVINLICLALQYQFATNFYEKYCKWIEWCWKRVFIKNAHNELIRKYEMQIQRESSAVKLSEEQSNTISSKNEPVSSKMDGNETEELVVDCERDDQENDVNDVKIVE